MLSRLARVCRIALSVGDSCLNNLPSLQLAFQPTPCTNILRLNHGYPSGMRSILPEVPFSLYLSEFTLSESRKAQAKESKVKSSRRVFLTFNLKENYTLYLIIIFNIPKRKSAINPLQIFSPHTS